MMKHPNSISLTFLLALTVFTLPSGVHALDIDQSSNIFKFQQKLAMNGNEHAQYKLASMYETGDGTEKDIEQAKHWFGIAAKSGYKPAMHRETYLIIKERGYKAEDADWLASIEADSNAHDADAVFLLAQLYHQGVGVEKDLNKSVELLNQIKILGLANVDKEIMAVKTEIAQADQAVLLKQQQRKEEDVRKLQSQKEQQIERQVQKEQQAEAEQISQAEKRRKYEEVMKQLALEQKKINDQQARVTGKSVGIIDDEI